MSQLNQDDHQLSESTPSEIKKWDELEIHPDILRGIYAYGFERPSPIQCKAITPILQKRDIIAQAQSGTGKTAAFTIGALGRIDLLIQATQILVLAPTRELTKQIAGVFTNLSNMMKNVHVKTLVGGTSSEEDVRSLRKNTYHVIVGCSGRVYDMLRRNVLITTNIKLVIIDEADEMMANGFKDQLYDIFQYLNNDVQVALFSATMSSDMDHIVNIITKDPVRIIVKKEGLTLEGIHQYYVALEDDKHKYEALKDLYASMSVSQCIIYCNSVKRVSDLHAAMTTDGFPVCCIHSNMEKSARDESLADFRNGKYRILVSSNVTARGIDIQQVSIVINFDLAKCVNTYLHRIGRSGRWGRKGIGINFITRRDISKMREIEQHYSTQIEELPINFIDTLA
jgi:translation initiation factor 4A